jgi:hypothetical protein
MSAEVVLTLINDLKQAAARMRAAAEATDQIEIRHYYLKIAAALDELSAEIESADIL